MQKFGPSPATRQGLDDAFAHASEPADPRLVFLSVLLLQLFAHVLRQRRAIAAGGDGNLEFSATDYCWRIKIAVARVVHGIAKHSSLLRLFIDLSIYRF